ncbi:MAG: ferrous iron transporter B [Pseudomonadota bacterium]
MKRVLLIGNPNVGKSVVFSRLTGVNVIASNYPGTTIEFTKGSMKVGDEKVEVIDVPGTYSLRPTCRAEGIALRILDELGGDAEGSVVVNVVDATNLERNLYLTCQLLDRKIPTVIALNQWDETKHLGISIDTDRLQEILGVPVVTTCALTGEGFKDLVASLPHARTSPMDCAGGDLWKIVGEIVGEVQQISHRHHTLLESIGDASIMPATGLPIAILVMAATFWLIRVIGEGLIGHVSEPLFEGLWAPVMMKLSGLLGGGGLAHNILIGRLIDGGIDFGQSFGLLTTGLFVPLGAVLPYVFAFFLILSILEDSGYLPRLSVLVDRTMHVVGLHGMSIIPMILGLGCNVPGVLACRVLETRRERFITMTLMSISIPCMALTAMIIALVGPYGARGLVPVFGTLFLVLVAVGVILTRLMKGESLEIFLEIPPYRLPTLAALWKKLWARMLHFLREAVPFVLLGVLIANLLYTTGVIDLLGRLAGPVITGVLGLPADAAGALVLGFLRKDVAVGMLLPLGLSVKQLIIASVVLSMYFPCVATFAVLVKELGVRDMLKSTAIMVTSALAVGGILNLVIP